MTCDQERFGPTVIGRNTISETVVYSTCCAIQNLWLAARAEGVGVEWVSIMEPAALRTILGIPERIVPVAYLCAGFVGSFPERPIFESNGWLPRLPLHELVFHDQWDERRRPDLLRALEMSRIDGAQATPAYGECGGLMYLSNGIRTLDGVLHPMVRLLPGEAEMKDRLQALGYVEVDTNDATILGPAGLKFRGHQFRYSDFRLPPEVECVYGVRRRRGGEVFQEGYRQGNTLASYAHAYWASNPRLAQGFVQACSAHARRVR